MISPWNFFFGLWLKNCAFCLSLFDAIVELHVMDENNVQWLSHWKVKVDSISIEGLFDSWLSSSTCSRGILSRWNGKLSIDTQVHCSMLFVHILFFLYINFSYIGVLRSQWPTYVIKVSNEESTHKCNVLPEVIVIPPTNGGNLPIFRNELVEFRFIIFYFWDRRPACQHQSIGGNWPSCKLFCQVERRFHSWESNRQPLPWDLDISPPSSSCLGSSRTKLVEFESGS